MTLSPSTSPNLNLLHSLPNQVSSLPYFHLGSLLVTTSLTLLLQTFELGGKYTKTPAGNRFKHFMILFTKEHLPASGFALTRPTTVVPTQVGC
jgi:hypothetical protein